MFSFLRPKRRYPQFIEPYEDVFDVENGRDAWLASNEDAQVEAVHLFAVHHMHKEVRQGGFRQFFSNPIGVIFPEARAGFDALGMPGVVQVLDRVAAKLGDDFPSGQDDRAEAIEDIDFRREDSEFRRGAHTSMMFTRPKFVPFADAYAYQATLRMLAKNSDGESTETGGPEEVFKSGR